MCHSDGEPRRRVRAERPGPVSVRAPRQAIGGAEGEIHDMLPDTGAEGVGRVEMPPTAVALNLEGVPLSFQGGPGAWRGGRAARRHEPRPRPLDRSVAS